MRDRPAKWYSRGVTRVKVRGVTIDVSDLERATGFWTTLLGLEVVGRRGSYVWLGEIGGGVRLVLQEVPERWSQKNRVHLDLVSDDPDDTIAMVGEMGGRWLSDVDEDMFALAVVADPDGNEFCVSRRASHGLLGADPDANMEATPTRKEVMET